MPKALQDFKVEPVLKVDETESTWVLKCKCLMYFRKTTESMPIATNHAILSVILNQMKVRAVARGNKKKIIKIFGRNKIRFHFNL